MTIEHVTLGYWYQRSTLHLSELFDFFTSGTSPLDLDKIKLKQFQRDLHIDSVEFKLDVLEHIDVRSGTIHIRLYEDGLVVLTKTHRQTKDDVAALNDYFESRFAPAVSYLFSLGAPTPKELAGIKDSLPYFLVVHGATKADMKDLVHELGGKTVVDMPATDVDIVRSGHIYVINHQPKFADIDGLIEMLIFFKEFKGQLHHYLNLHRSIWQKIATIKEQGSIRGKDVQAQRNELESYKKTIELIEGRINQMGLYMGAREAVIKTHAWEDVLTTLLQFKYENLRHSQDYVKSIWTMTKQYVDSAIAQFNEINSQSTKNSVQALTVITSLGIVNMVISFLGTKDYPRLTPTGMYYFVLLIAGTWILNRIVTSIYQTMKYKITNVALATDTKKQR